MEIVSGNLPKIAIMSLCLSTIALYSMEMQPLGDVDQDHRKEIAQQFDAQVKELSAELEQLAQANPLEARYNLLRAQRKDLADIARRPSSCQIATFGLVGLGALATGLTAYFYPTNTEDALVTQNRCAGSAAGLVTAFGACGISALSLYTHRKLEIRRLDNQINQVLQELR